MNANAHETPVTGTVAPPSPDSAAAEKPLKGDSVVERPTSGVLMQARGVSKAFHGRTVLKDINFQVASGEIAVLIGKSGSGKSTLLRIIAGLTAPDAGTLEMRGEEVIVDGEHRPSWKTMRGDVGMVFQNYTLWPHMSVRQNLCLAPKRVLRESSKSLMDRAARALAEVGMAHHLDSRCTQLSGGERQRVAIARALMMRPKLILCDEITSALDPPVAAEVLGVLTKLKNEEGIACVIVTHDMAFASKAADRVCFFQDGVIAEEGEPREVLGNPKTSGLRAFVEAIRF